MRPEKNSEQCKRDAQCISVMSSESRKVIARGAQGAFHSEAYREKRGQNFPEGVLLDTGDSDGLYGIFDDLRDPKGTFKNRQRGLTITHHLGISFPRMLRKQN